MSAPTPEMERFDELLAARAVGDIDAAETAELSALLAAHGDDESFDALAASLDAALAPVEDAPSAVVSSLRESAARFVRTPDADVVPDVAPDVIGRVAPTSSGFGGAALGWLAAAACLLLAVLAWMPSGPAPAAFGFDEVAAAPGALSVGLSADLAGEQPIGELVWDAAGQRGVMRFDGLAVNDPSVEQYQLWIFDGSREEFVESPLEIRHPVDGGVFDIGVDGVVEVPIDAKIPVGRPVLFAVTIEPPGGVVVSDRSRIAAVGIPG